jgi:tetratricopeptide (TPR) repeat protein
MVCCSSLFGQLISLFSRRQFHELVVKHRAERYAKGFNSWDHFVAMLFCQLAQAKSLREICGGACHLHGHEGDRDQAIHEYTKAIEINPRYADAYYGRGVVYQFKGKCDQARADYKKACELGGKEACKQLQKLQSR